MLRQEMIGGSSIEKAQSVLDMLGELRRVALKGRDEEEAVAKAHRESCGLHVRPSQRVRDGGRDDGLPV